MIEVTNGWDVLCNICILILENLSDITGLSYGFLNIILFVILGPMATLFFMLSAFVSFMNRTMGKRQRTIAVLFFVLGLLTIYAIIIPIIIAVLSLSF